MGKDGVVRVVVTLLVEGNTTIAHVGRTEPCQREGNYWIPASTTCEDSCCVARYPELHSCNVNLKEMSRTAITEAIHLL